MLLVGAVAVAMPFVLTLYAQQVLGYSAVEFGLGSVVLAVAVTVGAIVAQAAVLKVGFRPVAATGMALMGAGSLLLTQVSVGGSYFGDIFFGLLVVGPGIGLAFVTATVAALAGVAEHESGLASGLSNTALQIGGALGVAIVTTVAVSRSEHFLAANEGANPLVVLNEGFQSAFLAVVVLAGIGMALALLLPGRPRTARQQHLEPVPATSARGLIDSTNERRTEMGKIVISENVSLDGVIQDPAGDEGFSAAAGSGDRSRRGRRAVHARQGAGHRGPAAGSAELRVLRRAWPSRSGELADRLNSLPKYVVSSTLEDPDWNNSTVLKGDVVDEVSKLKQELDGEIVVLGSFQLVRTLIEHDLVDELRLMIYPVVLGAGARLFGETSDKKPMRLVDTQTVGDGIAILTYEAVRDAERSLDGASLQDKRAAALRKAGIRERA